MNPVHQDQLRLITRRWAQAHRRKDLLDWHFQTGMLLDMAGNAARLGGTENIAHASDLYLLAGLSYYRSLEFAPPDLSRLSRLICETA